LGGGSSSLPKARARGVVSASGCCRCRCRCRCRGGVAAAVRAPPRRVPPGAIDAGCGSGTEPGYAVGGGGPPDMRDCFARIVLHVLSGGGVASCRRSPSRLPPRRTRSPTPAGSQLPHSIAIGRRAECFPFPPLGVPPHSITDLVCGLPCPGAPSRGETEAGGQSKIHHYTFCFFSSPLRYQEEQMCAQFKRSNSQLQLFALEHPPHLVTSKT